MSAKKGNRFYIPDLDSDVEEEISEVVPLPNVPDEPSVKLNSKKEREWNLQDKTEPAPAAFRPWNSSNQSPQRHRKPFFRSYAFRDENDTHRAFHRHSQRAYAFRDEMPSSPPQESVKPTTPLSIDTEFPKLSDYVRPHTPPYPPDDKPYPTLSERIQNSLNKSFSDSSIPQKKEPEGYVLKMDSFIPSRNYHTQTLQIT